MMFGRYLVRVHMKDNQPTVEGILVSSRNGHYRLLKPVLLEAENRSHQLEGEVWVPKERVVFVQKL